MPGKKKITLTQAQINKLKKEITETAFKTSVQLFMLALHDEFGFGNKRLTRLMVRVDRYSDTIEQRLVGMKEMGEIWEKNTGFKMGKEESNARTDHRQNKGRKEEASGH